MSAAKKIALVVDDKIVARFADSVAGHEDAFCLHKNLASVLGNRAKLFREIVIEQRAVPLPKGSKRGK